AEMQIFEDQRILPSNLHMFEDATWRKNDPLGSERSQLWPPSLRMSGDRRQIVVRQLDSQASYQLCSKRWLQLSLSAFGFRPCQARPGLDRRAFVGSVRTRQGAGRWQEAQRGRLTFSGSDRGQGPRRGYQT